VSSLKLALLALVLEAAAIGALFAPGQALPLLGAFFAAHGCASLAVAVAMTRFVPELYPKSERSAFGYFAALGFFVPVLGVVALLLLLVSAQYVPTGPRREPFQLVEGPRYSGAPVAAASGFNRAGIRPVLQSRSAPVELKLKALLALQAIPSRAANNLIREMLREPVDDMRLLAYGLLDAREKVLDARIHALKVRLDAVTAPGARAPILKELAESYWELVYRGIVQGDLLRHSAAEALRYLGESLKGEPDDPGAWALHGRLLSIERRDREADEAFGTAVALGLPESRVLPYRAELAFRARDFERVRLLMRQVGLQPANALAAVARYWDHDDNGKPGL
jgi:polysaccharide biosynthesis protein PelE